MSRFRFKPMKAVDLSGEVAWHDPADPFRSIHKHLDDRHVAEPKVNGCRVYYALRADGRSVVGTERSERTPGHFPHLATAPDDLDGTVLDCEATWQQGMATAVLNSTASNAVRKQRHTEPVHLTVFDVLAWHGMDTTALSYDDRRVLVEDAVARLDSPHVTAVEQYPATAESIAAALADGHEGVVLKYRHAPYTPGRRSTAWLKVKRTQTADLVVMGLAEPGRGGNTGRVGSVRVGYTAPDGSLVEVGHVGGGLTFAERDAITDPATGGLRPEFVGAVIEVSAQERTADGRLRHPRFVRFRPDKAAADCGPDQFENFHQMRGAA